MSSAAAQLSCYSTSLVAYLLRYQPAVTGRMAAAIRLAVRTDLPGGQVAFSHHRRVDRHDGHELHYAGAARPSEATAGVRAELAAAGAVIVVANTSRLPWSPAYLRAATPHWLLLSNVRDDQFQLVDPLEALLPHGEQAPFAGWVSQAELLRYMELPGGCAEHVARRDRLALGAAVEVPDAARWRWLRRGRAAAPAGGPDGDQHPAGGEWLLDTAAALRWLAGRVAGDAAALDRCVDDLWAASRHHVFRAGWLRDRGLLPARHADLAAARWAELPRALRFAADSACRGRPRAGMVRTTLERLADVADDRPDHSTPLGRTHA